MRLVPTLVALPLLAAPLAGRGEPIGVLLLTIAADARPFRQALLWLGERLIAWGERLRERYDAAADPPMLPAIDRSR